MTLRFNIKIIFAVFTLVLISFTDKLFGQTIPDTVQKSWADSVLTSLSIEEKIAQLMMIRTYSNKDQAYYNKVEETIKKFNIGGLCFFQGGPLQQAKLTNRYQSISKNTTFYFHRC